MVAVDGALESGTRMRPEHIYGVLDWLHDVIAKSPPPVVLSLDELVLIAHAFGDAIRAPIHEINTQHVSQVLKDKHK